MPTIAENLQTRYENVAAELAAIDATMAGGLPDVSGPNAVAHVAYRLSLLEELDRLKQLLADMGVDVDGNSTSFEITTEGHV